MKRIIFKKNNYGFVKIKMEPNLGLILLQKHLIELQKGVNILKIIKIKKITE